MIDQIKEPFLDLVPKRGWLHDYIQYTSWSEGPAAFQFFIGCAVIGAAVGRRIAFNKGYYKIYPNLQLLLVAPSGKCRKSTTAGIGVKLLNKLGDVNVIQDKATPESLAGALDQPLGAQINIDGKIQTIKRDAEAVVFAPELAVLLGKQKYNEGMIALLTSMFDSPDDFTVRTKKEGAINLKNVCVTFIGASTVDWLISAIPQDAFGGGFMSRILFVAQEDTPRCYPIPIPQTTPQHLVDQLAAWRKTSPTEVTMDQKATNWYVMWYSASRKNVPEDTKMAGYHERKPDHLTRIALILAISEGRNVITTDDLMIASKILSFLEKEMLITFKWLGVRPVGQDQERIIRTMKSMNGKASFSTLLRKMIFYMNAQQFRNSMETLVQSNMVKHDMSKNEYYLLEEGKDGLG